MGEPKQLCARKPRHVKLKGSKRRWKTMRKGLAYKRLALDHESVSRAFRDCASIPAHSQVINMPDKRANRN